MKMNKLLALIILLCLTMTTVAFMETADDLEIIEIEEAIVAEKIEPTVAEVDEIELGELSLDEALPTTVDDIPLLGDDDYAEEILAPDAVSNKAASGIPINATNFPDANFRAYVSINCDIDQDGYLSESERSSIDSVDVRESNISSLVGIEYFPNLTSLSCAENNISILDLRNNQKLQRLYCCHNRITVLDISNNQEFYALECWANKINTLDISNCQILLSLIDEEHKDSGIDYMGCPYIGYSYTAPHSDDYYYWIFYDEGVTLITGSTPSGICINKTNFPDPVFRAYVSENFDTDHNGYLSDTEIALIRTVSVPDRGIASLDGIEYFTDMETLICQNNKLKELSVGSNYNLRYLNCIGNSISSLDFTNNPTLVSYIKREGVIRDGNTTRFVPIDKIEETDPYLAFDSSVVVKANDAVICSLYEPITRTIDPITIGVKEKVYCLTTKPDTPYWLRQKAGAYVLLADTSNKKVAKTNSSGYVIGVKTGKAKITITTPAAVILTYTVNVKKAPSKVILSSTAMTLGVGEELPLTVTLPKGTASFNMTWTSSNPDVADFDDYGMIHGRKKGIATITIKAFNKKKATCKVTVLPIIESVSLPVSTLTLGVKQTYTLKPTLTPKASGSQLYTFSSSNKKVVSVTAAGKLTAKKKGTAKITVTTWNGLTASCTVSVVKVPKLTIKPTKASLYPGGMVQLTHSFPAYLPEEGITWESSSPKLAAVNAYGLVFAKGVGTVTITAKAYNGQTAKCKITISKDTTHPTVDENSDPESIRFVQKMLSALGHLSKSNINGIYDANTRTAVKSFQKWINQTMGKTVISVTGAANPKTLTALEYVYDDMID